MDKWEYKVERIQSSLYNVEHAEELLNGYGNGGWELVNIIPQIASSNNDNDQVEDVYVEFNALVFKRKRN